MGHQHCFHAPGKTPDFLGWRLYRQGRTEIVYDDCTSKRMVWRAVFEGEAGERLDEALSFAVEAGHDKLIPTLFEELKKRAIAVALI